MTSESDSVQDIIVIGAGSAGLSAACASARLGLDVLLLDKFSQAGEMGPPLRRGYRAPSWLCLRSARRPICRRSVWAGDTSAKRLTAHDRLLHGLFLRGMETEGKIILNLALMTDEEMDRVRSK